MAEVTRIPFGSRDGNPPAAPIIGADVGAVDPSDTPTAPAAPRAPVGRAQLPRQAQAPVAAQAAQAPATPPPQTLAQKLKVRFRHEDLELPTDEVVRLAAKGMSATKLEEQRAEFTREREANRQILDVGNLMAQFAQRDPQGFQEVIGRVQHGRPIPQAQPQRRQAPPENDGLGDDEPLTQQQQPLPIDCFV